MKDYPLREEPDAAEKKGGPMPVSSYQGLAQYLFWTLPLYAALGLLVYNLQKQKVPTETGDLIPLISMTTVYVLWGVLAAFYIFACIRILKFNLPRLKQGIPEKDKFAFSSVGALNTTYFANFGAELAVVSMLPLFYFETFGNLTNAGSDNIMTKTLAGAVAFSFAFMNLVARPLGGYLSDKMGNRRKTMLLYMLGITIGFCCMGFIGKYAIAGTDGISTIVPAFNGIWWLVVSVCLTMLCSLFVQGSEGATFAMIPTIKKEITGRIAGMAGAYGNVGAVTYLFIFTMVDSKTFFYVLAGGVAVSFVYCLFALKEPKYSFNDEEKPVEQPITTVKTTLKTT